MSNSEIVNQRVNNQEIKADAIMQYWCNNIKEVEAKYVGRPEGLYNPTDGIIEIFGKRFRAEVKQRNAKYADIIKADGFNIEIKKVRKNDIMIFLMGDTIYYISCDKALKMGTLREEYSNRCTANSREDKVWKQMLNIPVKYFATMNLLNSEQVA